MTCKHAIIITGGYGTRRLPITKAVEKCMLPILDRPLVDYIVEDCIKAGVEHIVFVVSEGSTQIKDFYSQYEALETYLKKHGKEDYLALVTPPNLHFEYVEQPNEQLFNHYGTNTAVAMARPFIPEGEPALVLMGDALIFSKEGESPLKQFVDAVPDGESGVLTKEMPAEDLGRYGVLAVKDENYLDYMVEKPAAGKAPSNLVNLGEFIFTSQMLDETVVYFNDPIIPGKEKFVNIEPLNRYLEKGGKMEVVTVQGEYLDVGTLKGWLAANNHMANIMGVL